MMPTNAKRMIKNTAENDFDIFEDVKMSNKNVFISFSATKKFDECDYYFKLVLRRAIVATLEHECFNHPVEVSVTLCDNEYIRNLNREYRNKDSATDVLSFPIYDFNELDPEKHWFDVTISQKSQALGFTNYLFCSLPVIHRPHSSRPWKQLKYTNPMKYYWKKFTKGFDKI